MTLRSTRTTSLSRRRLGTAVISLTALTLTACSSGADSRKKAAEGSASKKPPTPMERLKAAKKVMDSTSGMHLTLTSKGVPDTASGVTAGEGDGSNQPAFKGNLKARAAGIAADVPVVGIDSEVWAKLPIWPDMRRINPQDYGAPNPAMLFSKDNGLSSLMMKTKKAKFGKEKRDGSDVVREVTGELAGKDVLDVLALGNAAYTYQVVYLLTEADEMRSAAVTGVFFNDATTTYTLRLTEYGKQVDVKPPA